MEEIKETNKIVDEKVDTEEKDTVRETTVNKKTDNALVEVALKDKTITGTYTVYTKNAYITFKDGKAKVTKGMKVKLKGLGVI